MFVRYGPIFFNQSYFYDKQVIGYKKISLTTVLKIIKHMEINLIKVRDATDS